MGRTIKWSAAFKRDLKRERKTDRQVDSLLRPVLVALTLGNPLAKKYKDHALTGTWKPCRECHIKPDLLLVYDCPDNETVLLVRLGSHAELGFA